MANKMDHVRIEFPNLKRSSIDKNTVIGEQYYSTAPNPELRSRELQDREGFISNNKGRVSETKFEIPPLRMLKEIVSNKPKQPVRTDAAGVDKASYSIPKLMDVPLPEGPLKESIKKSAREQGSPLPILTPDQQELTNIARLSEREKLKKQVAKLHGGYRPDEMGWLEETIIGDRPGSLTERASENIKNQIVGSISGAVKGGALIPMVLGQGVKFVEYAPRAAYSLLTGNDITPANQMFMAGNAMEKTAETLFKASKQFENWGNFDSEARTAQFMKDAWEIGINLGPAKSLFKVADRAIDGATTIYHSAVLNRKMAPGIRAARDNNLKNQKDFIRNDTNALDVLLADEIGAKYFAKKAAFKPLLVKHYYSALKSGSSIAKDAKTAGALETVARARLQWHEAMNKISQEWIQNIIPYYKGQFYLVSTGPKWRNFEWGIRKKDSHATSVGFKKGEGGTWEKVAYTKSLSPKAIKDMKMLHRTLLVEASTAGAVGMSLYDDWFKGTSAEPYRMFIGGIGGMFLAPSISVQMLGKTISKIETAAQTISAPLPGGKAMGLGEDRVGLGTILLLGGLLSRNLRRRKAREFDASGNVVVKEELEQTRFGESKFEKRIIASLLGVPLHKAFSLSDAKPVMRTIIRKDGSFGPGTEPLFPRKIVDKNGKSVVSGLTHLDLAMNQRTKDMDTLTNLAAFMEKNLSEEEILPIIQIFEAGEKLSVRLDELGADASSMERFMVTQEAIQKAIVSQVALGTYSKMIRDRKFQSMFGKGDFRLPEKVLLYNTLLSSMQEAEENLHFLASRLKELADDPIAAKEMKEFIIRSEEMIANLSKSKDDFKEMVTIITGEKGAGSMLADFNHSIIQKAVHGSPEDGGLSLNSKFRFDEEETVNSVGTVISPTAKSLEDHFDSAFGQIQASRLKIDEKVRQAYGFKNDASNPAHQAFQETMDATPIFNALDDLRFKELDKEGINLQNILGDDFTQSGITQSSSLVLDITTYSRYLHLQNKDKEYLVSRLSEIIDNDIPVTLREGSYKIGNTNTSTPIQHILEENGSLDLKGMLRNLEEYSVTHAQAGGVKGQEEYLKRLLANLVPIEGSYAKSTHTFLNEILRRDLKIDDIFRMSEAFSTYGFTNSTKAKGVSTLNFNESLIKELDDLGITSMSAEAKELWQRKLNIQKVLGKEFTMQSDSIGTKSIKNNYELLDLFFTRNSDLIVGNTTTGTRGVYNDLFDPITLDGKTEKLFTTSKTEMNQILSDHIAVRILSEPNKFLRPSNYSKIEALHSKGIVNDNTFNFIKDYKKNIYDKKKLASVTKEYKATEAKIQSNIKVILDAATEAQLSSSFMKGLSDVKSADDLVEFLTVSNTHMDTLPVISKSRVGTRLETLRKDIEGLFVNPKDDMVTIIENNPDIFTGPNGQETYNRVLRIFEPVEQTERVVRRVDEFFEKIIGIPKGTRTITTAQRKDLENFENLLHSTLADKAINTTNTRRSVFSKDKSGTLDVTAHSNDFGLGFDIDPIAFANYFKDLRPVFNRIDELTGNTARSKGLDDLFKAAVLATAKGVDTGQKLQDLIGTMGKGITIPAALSRLYAGLRGVVSWKYLAGEQMVRQRQLKEQELLVKLVTDPDLIRDLTVILQKGKLDTTRYEKLIKRIRNITGGRILAYNEAFEETSDPTQEEFRQSFVGFMTAFARTRSARDLRGEDIPIDPIESRNRSPFPRSPANEWRPSNEFLQGL